MPLTLHGTAFQQRVWTALREIPYGETISYGELATEIGNPAASRAVGLANGRNPIGVIVPCHRVVGSTGDLTGYGGGIERKRFLLAFERETRTGAKPPPSNPSSDPVPPAEAARWQAGPSGDGTRRARRARPPEANGPRQAQHAESVRRLRPAVRGRASSRWNVRGEG
ncbi:methylated-DNA--[protein]-cysteine S-methyltransferase [Actinomadura sp. J1-007]|uniref:methylated-DNA--[protein]-cysteine S-methyltransferase n=1 Tax=Actinomadura sp. J1-007 TaxID=2661913 RepID=UPI001369651C|nr:methylated-DNA--[protein]-cysteine S-methyltransferase [Actinomadura sp. J1-007]